MKRRVLRAFLLACLAAGCASSRVPGVSIERIPTASLPEPAKILVLLPPSYAKDTARRYPVLYFLHDAWGDARSLDSNGVAAKLEALMSRGDLPEFLLVAPGAPASWFSDSRDGVHRYEEFLTGDLISQIETRYRVRGEQGARGITGISMGGYGAFKIALKHPGLYGSVSSLSGALIPFDWDDLARYNPFARWSLKHVFGSSREENSLAANDVWEILGALHFDRPPFAAHLRAGAQDVYGLNGVAAQFGAFLMQHGVPATVVLESGGHDWAYWRRAMLSIAAWHGRQFSYD